LTTKRAEINAEAKRMLQEILDSYSSGVRIETVNLQDVNPPDKVQPAFNEVNQAKQEKERMINEALQQYNKVIPQAAGGAEKTVLEEALSVRDHSEQTVRSALGSFLFRGEAVFKKVKVLSGGEKSRLSLVKLLLDPPNVLLMDEPTTHLDLDSVEALVSALSDFEGTLCFISHDLYFVNALANHVVHVHQGIVTLYPGNYDYFISRTSPQTS
jgi:ATPase subunit of ABC transporter with duplicated ATPase domains